MTFSAPPLLSLRPLGHIVIIAGVISIPTVAAQSVTFPATELITSDGCDGEVLINWPSHSLSLQLNSDVPEGVESEVSAVLREYEDGVSDNSDSPHWEIITRTCIEQHNTDDADVIEVEDLPTDEDETEPSTETTIEVTEQAETLDIVDTIEVDESVDVLETIDAVETTAQPAELEETIETGVPATPEVIAEPEVPAEPVHDPAYDKNSSPPTDGTTYVSTMSPIRSTNGPLCLRPAVDAEGLPLYNERGNCPVVLYHANLAFGDFILASNAWNFCASTLPDWEQCISVDTVADSVTPRWDYDWGNESDVNGQVWLVKSYPEIIYGIKSPHEYSGSSLAETPAETGLPARVSDMPFYQIDYAFSSEQNDTRSKEHDGSVLYGERNIAVESFFHELDGECDATSLVRNGNTSNQRYEIMLWLDKGAERLPAAPGDFVASVKLDGMDYDVYTKPGDAEYIAFVAQTPTSSGQINWTTFVDWSREYAHQLTEIYGRGSNTIQIEDDWCMANILLGTEIWWGSGYFQADEWTIHRTVSGDNPVSTSTDTSSDNSGEVSDSEPPILPLDDGTAANSMRSQSSGCTISSSPSAIDPMMYLLLLLSFAGLRRGMVAQYRKPRRAPGHQTSRE